jgi:predicted SprT family Zn-dependent metalloprotease
LIFAGVETPAVATVSPEQYRVSPECSHEEFLAVSRVYARAVAEEHDLSVPVNRLGWEVSTRAKRRAGAVRYRDDRPQTVVLTWGYFERAGWEAMAATIRHELIHVHLIEETDDPSHCDRFRELADRLDTHVHCERFTDPEWWVVCVDCGAQLARYRESKLVTDPDEYRCGDCGGRFRVERAGGESKS